MQNLFYSLYFVFDVPGNFTCLTGSILKLSDALAKGFSNIGEFAGPKRTSTITRIITISGSPRPSMNYPSLYSGVS